MQNVVNGDQSSTLAITEGSQVNLLTNVSSMFLFVANCIAWTLNFGVMFIH